MRHARSPTNTATGEPDAETPGRVSGKVQVARACLPRLIASIAENLCLAYDFLAVERDQVYLLPPSVADWLPEDRLAWFVLLAVDEMDLAPFYAGYRSDGWGGTIQR